MKKNTSESKIYPEKGFKKGYNHLKTYQAKPFKERVVERLGIQPRWYYKLFHGHQTITSVQARIIEEVFAEFGINNPREIWETE